jgi:hypothetical protein
MAVSEVTHGGIGREAPAAPAGAIDIATGVTELHDVLLSTQSIEDFVQELAVQAGQLIADSLSCGITLRRGTQHDTVACSDELAGRVNGLQYSLGEGPCLTALADGRPAYSADLAADPRWPRFAAAAVAEGIQSALSLPLIAQEQVIGALNLYARGRAAFGETETRLAEKFAAAGLVCRPDRSAARRAGLAGGHRPGRRHPDGPGALFPAAGVRGPADRFAESKCQAPGAGRGDRDGGGGAGAGAASVRDGPGLTCASRAALRLSNTGIR